MEKKMYLCSMKRLYILLLTYYMLLPVAAQKIVPHQFTTVNGLSDNSALCALRDSYGLLWVGTENGLNYLDGLRVQSYRDILTRANSNEINTVKSLFEHNRDIWMGGSSGLYVFDRQNNRYYRFSKRTRYGVTISSAVPKIFETDNGLVWILTHGQGIFIYDTQADSLWQDSRHGSFFTDAAVGPDCLVYAVTLDKNLIVFRDNGQYLQQYSFPDITSDKNSVSITSTATDLWLGYDTKLLRLDADGIEQQGFFPALGSIHSLVSDSRGGLYIGSDNGVMRYDPDTRELVSVSKAGDGRMALTDNMVNCLEWDADSTLLVLTRMGGVNMIQTKEGPFLFVPLPDEVSSTDRNIVRALCRGPHGELWMGTDRGIYRGNYSKHEIVHYAYDRIPYETTSLMMNGNDLWIGTRHNGIRVMNIETGDIKAYTFSANIPYTIPSNEINSIYRTSHGDIYVLTNWGLDRFDPSNGHFYGFANISANTSFICMQESANGWLWTSSSNRGLYCRRTAGGSFERFMSKTIRQQTVVVMHKDSRGDFWVATNGGGLYRFNDQQGDFERYDKEGSPLYNQAVSFIEEDSQHALWLGTLAGIIRISPSRDIRDLQVFGNVRNFDVTQVQRSSCAYGYGFVLFGGNGGIYRFSTSMVKSNTDMQHVYIDAISFPFAGNNEEERRRLMLDGPLYTRQEIELPYSNNTITLHFASARYSDNPEAKYEYMLEGYDQTWALGTTTPEATYVNLPPGNYKFLLRRVGQANPDIYAQLAITILPPWYRTWLAYLIYILIVVSIVFYFYSRTKRRLKRRYERQMQTFQQEQEKQTFQSKIRFFIDLVHEIRTPLTLISLPLEQMEDSQLSDENRHHAQSIRRNMNYLLGITNQLLDFQKQENGGIPLVRRKTDLCHMLNEIYQQFDDAVRIQGKNICLELPEEPVIAFVDSDKLTKVMTNLVGNAVKYAKSEIIIRLHTDADDKTAIDVIDDGNGVPPEERDKIFDRYYQIGKDSTAATLGTGLGLAYAKMLAEVHNGDLCYEDAPGGGSCFTLILPVGQAPDTGVQDEIVEDTGVQEEAAIDEEVLKENAEDNEAEDSEASGATIHRSTFRILLAEDNEELLHTTTNALRKWYKVIKAHDGVEALDLLKYQEVDIVVTDVMMPRMDGIELCSRLKEDIDTSHLPVIMLTAKTAVDAKVEGMESGANIYLEKPFAIRQLHLQIENLLRLRQQFYERMRKIDGMSSVATLSDSQLGMTQQDLQFIERMQQLVEENMRDEEFNIDNLAEQLNMSRSSFYRKIKGLTGMTPTNYLKTARMNQAAYLLCQGYRSSEVCERIGFTSTSYFAKCFRTHFGCLPKDYIQNRSEEE